MFFRTKCNTGFRHWSIYSFCFLFFQDLNTFWFFFFSLVGCLVGWGEVCWSFFFWLLLFFRLFFVLLWQHCLLFIALGLKNSAGEPLDPTVLPSGNNLTTLSYLLCCQIFLCNFMVRQKEEPANPCWDEEVSQ